MTESTNNAKVLQKRVGLTVFVTEEMRDKLLCIANAEDLSMSDVLRRAIKEYTDKVSE
jgi:ribbon-helix-helix protein, copG family|nr:MAG TPA: repressor [Caudoviricetes sp.]DAN03172.1 MAG TPA: repressor [Caudoviricetes sp.]